MPETLSSSHAIKRAGEGLGRIVVSPASALIELMTFGSPVERIKQDTRSGLSDIFWAPFRVAGHMAAGAAKGTAKLAWAGIKNAPVFPIYNQEREGITQKTGQSLQDLAYTIKFPGQKEASPLDALRKAA